MSARGLGQRLYRGETTIDVVGRRRLWYSLAGLVVGVSLGALALLGLNLGIEFTGGAEFRFPAGETTVAQARDAVVDTGVGQPIVQQVGEDLRVQTSELTEEQVGQVSAALSQLTGIPPEQLSPSTVGAAWGQQVTSKAVQGLLFFLVVVVAYLSVRFEPKMAVAALVALLHDLVITVGVFALLRFEVTPATVIGLLTILGYSLYDTVVVFDKVQENTRGLLGASRASYSEASNLAVNQTLARSINTSVIALLPVAALLFVGAGLLGAGTLVDLSLALFVGIAAGTYSSIFLATPVLAHLKERDPRYRALAGRVAARRAGRAEAEPAGAGTAVAGSATATAVLDRDTDAADDDEDREPPISPPPSRSGGAAGAGRTAPRRRTSRASRRGRR